MATHDVDFDVVAANNWKLEVEMELSEVDRVLNEVSQQCTTIPGEQDTIMKGIEEAGQVMSEAWNTLTGGFAQMVDIFGDIITGREKAINNVVDQFQDYKNTFHN